jgi:hypothetical protein
LCRVVAQFDMWRHFADYGVYRDLALDLPSLTCHRMQPSMNAHVRHRFAHRPNHLALPHHREARGRRYGCRPQSDNKAPTVPRTYQAAMKAVNARKTMLKTFDIAERGTKNQTGNQTQNTTKYEKKMAMNDRLGRDFAGILW